MTTEPMNGKRCQGCGYALPWSAFRTVRSLLCRDCEKAAAKEAA